MRIIHREVGDACGRCRHEVSRVAAAAIAVAVHNVAQRTIDEVRHAPAAAMTGVHDGSVGCVERGEPPQHRLGQLLTDIVLQKVAGR